MAAGALLGESRLMLPTDDILRNRPHLRAATVVADGHAVILEISTAEARTCFTEGQIGNVRRLADVRRCANSRLTGSVYEGDPPTGLVERVAYEAAVKVQPFSSKFSSAFCRQCALGAGSVCCYHKLRQNGEGGLTEVLARSETGGIGIAQVPQPVPCAPPLPRYACCRGADLALQTSRGSSRRYGRCCVARTCGASTTGGNLAQAAIQCAQALARTPMGQIVPPLSGRLLKFALCQLAVKPRAPKRQVRMLVIQRALSPPCWPQRQHKNAARSKRAVRSTCKRYCNA